MEFKNFTYTKKKDGETKGYFILVMEDTESYIGGLDLGKLDDSEIKDVFSNSIKAEALESTWKQEAEKRDEHINDIIESDPSKKAEIAPYREAIQGYMKKAYRKYLKSNIQDPGVDDFIVEE